MFNMSFSVSHFQTVAFLCRDCVHDPCSRLLSSSTMAVRCNQLNVPPVQDEAYDDNVAAMNQEVCFLK